ncbi:Glucose-dependent insulinotropic receptor [Portunus trituberculatus]|uniref:Glucose-dependent insulinotropic receptor n=1 Tax=Portunus trituberculatus TaxID=210409 RepID=A0A5B7IP47_PORTR|nr:Glucose-dependent insulinotropic receptor [Portunus trituberculatus]
MHKARYGGSYTAKESARSTNFRLSFMSSKKSRTSTTTTTTSCTSKSSRRRERRKEMALQKEELARRGEKGRGYEDTVLITGSVSKAPVCGKPCGVPVEANNAGVVAGKYTKGGAEREVGKETDADEERRMSSRDEVETGDAYPDEPPPQPQPQTKDVDSGVTGTRKGDGSDPKTETKKRKTSDSQADPGVTSDQTKTEGDSHLEEHPPGLKKQTTPRKTHTRRKDSHETQDSTFEEQEGNIEDLLDTDEEEEEKDDEGKGWRSLFPSKYMNKVMTETIDKVMFLKKCRAVKTVLLILISFTATYVPFVVGSLVYSAEQQKRPCLLHLLNTLLYCAVVANSLANPLIYAYGYREFRLRTEKFKGIFARKKKRTYT